MNEVARTLTNEDFVRAAKTLNVEVAAIRAVAEVEARSGFLPDGRPTILYEAHVFHAETKGAHVHARDRRGVKLSSSKWDNALYGSEAGQHHRYEDARQLDADAANKACSWGTFQILGQNYKVCGFGSSQEFVDAMWTGGARAHLDVFVKFIQANKLDMALRKKDWKAFARGYNGPAYAKNAYDQKMANAYARWKAKG